MAAINEAWRVVGDPQRRHTYDLSLASPFAPAAARESDPVADFVEPRYNPFAKYQDPPRFPWRLMAWLTAGGIALVVLGVITAGDPPPSKVDNVLRPGDCVIIEDNGDAAERLCDGPHDATVKVFQTNGELCPVGTEPHRDRQGMGTVCVVPIER